MKLFKTLLILIALPLLTLTLLGCGGGGGSKNKDTTPDTFSFVASIDRPISTPTLSNSVVITGITQAAPVSVAGGEYSIDNSSFTNNAGTISSGQEIRVRGTSSASFSTSINVTLTVGGVSSAFVISTEARDISPAQFIFTAESDVALGIEKISNIITVSGINDATPISVVGGEYRIDDGDFTTTEGVVSANQNIQVRHTTSSLNNTSTNTTLTIGGISSTYSTHTIPYAGQLAVIASGTDLVLIGIDPAGQIVERSRASLSEMLTDYNTNHVIFSITKHPLADMVLVTSMNECGATPLETDGCWGNGRIDRFTYDSNTITYDGLAFLAQGPLRLSTPSLNEETAELTIELTNQGSDDITITELTATNLTPGSTFTTTCNGLTLNSSAQCNLVITAGEEEQATADISITTPVGNFSTSVNHSNYSMSYTVDALAITQPNLNGIPECALDDGDTMNQLGSCALTAIAISNDGTRAYVNEDSEDSALVFSLDQEGNMILLSEGAPVELQGIAINHTNTVMYNGSNSYAVVEDIATVATEGTGGNATEVLLTDNEQQLLITTIDNTTLNIYELDTDPLIPNLIASATPSVGKSRYQAHSADLGLFVVVDLARLTSFSFDGESLIEKDSINTAITFDDCEGCNYDANARTVQVTPDGLFAVTSVFVNTYDEMTLESVPYHGAAIAYAIDAETNALTEASKLTFNGMSRALLFVDTP